MEAPYCDVIGCHSLAQWRLIGTRDGLPVEQNLCQPHWRKAMADRTLKVQRWVRATPEESSDAEPRQGTSAS